jgi:mannose-6-phosphate isomerase-like protein (cupin superfamily)
MHHPAIVIHVSSVGVTVTGVPYRVDKPWGHELIWALTDRYVGKVIHVRAGHVLSCQYHEKKDETMHVLSGELILRIWESPEAKPVERSFKPGDSVHITAGTIHNIEAIVDSDVLEASTPELDDVIRLNDRYGRT